MASFEYEVAQNLSGIEGTLDGYFAVQSPRNFSLPLYECNHALDEAGLDNPIIYIAHDEFGMGSAIGSMLAEYEERLGSIVTFGTDQDRFLNVIDQKSHLAIWARELAESKDNFLMPLLQLPEGQINTTWNHLSPLSEVHLKFGSVTVGDSVCIISVDENVQPLPDLDSLFK